MNGFFQKTTLIILLGALGACSLAPKYVRPPAPIPEQWPMGAAYPKTGPTSAPRALDLGWREFFTDAKLQQVVNLALENNRDLRLATLNVERARAWYGIQRAELLPAIHAVASGLKQRVSGDLTATGEPMTVEQYSVNFGVLSWEIDFFGRIRSLKGKALEEYLASEQAHRSAQILLIAAVANAYLTLAADREQLHLARSTLEAQQAAYEIVRRRFEKGLAPELDLRQAQTRVDAVRADIALYSRLAAQDLNMLTLLAGVPIPPDLLPENLSGIAAPRDVSVGLPSEVLLQRPDILQAERMLRAANANIGAARAAFFPRITLSATVGSASNELSGLFDSGTRAWTYAPQMVMPIFDARTWSALKASKVERQIVLTQYEKAIQSAFREVADALALRGTVEDQLAAQQSLVDAVAETCRLANARYAKGVDSYLTVLDAQRSLYGAQQGLVAVRLAQAGSLIRLYAALGGGSN
ncbi:MAG: efflux transporter outer membrane subunit [Candidatus Sumerlaeia bacterium]|nr:efflux transporter outer membrane subunit [Candidatus Sumerlaeia bacterium]